MAKYSVVDGRTSSLYNGETGSLTQCVQFQILVESPIRKMSAHGKVYESIGHGLSFHLPHWA